MFQRSLFTAALLVGAAFLSPAMAQDSSSRMDQLEQQIRALTGQVEELTYEVKQLRKQSTGALEQDAQPTQRADAAVEKPKRDRTQQQLTLEEAPSATGSADSDGIEIVEDPAVAAVAPRQKQETSIYGDDQEQGVALLPAPSSGLSRKKAAQAGDGGFQGVVVDPGTDPDTGSTGTALSANDNLAVTNQEGIEQVALTTETAEGLYKKSDEALLRRQFDIASNGFTKFVQTYPEHSLAGSAQYWLGETYYAQGDFRTAAQNYLKAYQKYPKSRRAPDSLLKLGLALNKLGQKDQGCAALGNVGSEYPKAVEAKKRAQVEARRAGC